MQCFLPLAAGVVPSSELFLVQLCSRRWGRFSLLLFSRDRLIRNFWFVQFFFFIIYSFCYKSSWLKQQLLTNKKSPHHVIYLTFYLQETNRRVHFHITCLTFTVIHMRHMTFHIPSQFSLFMYLSRFFTLRIFAFFYFLLTVQSFLFFPIWTHAHHQRTVAIHTSLVHCWVRSGLLSHIHSYRPLYIHTQAFYISPFPTRRFYSSKATFYTLSTYLWLLHDTRL